MTLLPAQAKALLKVLHENGVEVVVAGDPATEQRAYEIRVEIDFWRSVVGELREAVKRRAE